MKYIKYFEELTEKVLIIENEAEVDKDFYKEISDMTGSKPEVLTALKFKRREQIGIAINNANTIALQSIFGDEKQVDTFMKLFSQLPRKKVIIKLRNQDKYALESHPLFETNSLRHEIIFIYEDEIS